MTDHGGSIDASIDAAIDALSGGALSLLEDSIRINSVNPEFIGVRREDVIGGETRCARLIGDFLGSHGFELHEVAPDPDRVNVVARARGTGGGRSLIVNGHVDTVAPFRPDQWLGGSPWTPIRRDGRIYGLGATDMAAGLVSGALAAAALVRAGITLAGDLMLHAVVGEETGSHRIGTSAVLEAGFTADAAIVAEPSSCPEPLSIAPVSVGSLSLWITVRGRGSHAGNRADAIRSGRLGASAGVNAVEKLIALVVALQKLEHDWGFSKRHPAFQAGQFTMMPSVFHGDVGFPSVGYMADRAEVGFIVWYSPDEEPSAVRAEIEAFIAHAAALDPWLRENPPELDWRRNWPAANTSPDHPLVRLLVEQRASVRGRAPGRDTRGFTAVSDATWFEAKGIAAVVFGPGNLRVAHALNEYVEIAEVIDAARIMARTMLRWCGAAP